MSNGLLVYSGIRVWGGVGRSSGVGLQSSKSEPHLMLRSVCGADERRGRWVRWSGHFSKWIFPLCTKIIHTNLVIMTFVQHMGAQKNKD